MEVETDEKSESKLTPRKRQRQSDRYSLSTAKSLLKSDASLNQANESDSECDVTKDDIEADEEEELQKERLSILDQE